MTVTESAFLLMSLNIYIFLYSRRDEYGEKGFLVSISSTWQITNDWFIIDGVDKCGL